MAHWDVLNFDTIMLIFLSLRNVNVRFEVLLRVNFKITEFRMWYHAVR